MRICGCVLIIIQLDKTHSNSPLEKSRRVSIEFEQSCKWKVTCVDFCLKKNVSNVSRIVLLKKKAVDITANLIRGRV